MTSRSLTNSQFFIPRYNNAFGEHADTFYSAVGYQPEYPWGTGSWGDSVYPHTRKYALRELPAAGSRLLSGFRLPTRWSMVSLQADYRSFAYTASYQGLPWTRYNVRGDGPDSTHGVPVLPFVSIVGGKAVVEVGFNISNRSRMQAIGKIKKQNINVGAALGESRTTVRSLASLVSRLAKALLYFMKGQFKKAFDAIGIGTKRGLKKDLASLWLEFQYGIKPLVSDIYGLQEQIKNGFEKPQLFSVSSEVVEATPASNFWSVKAVSVEGPSLVLSRTTFWQEISRPWLYNLNQLGVINPASIAWELTRLSFVIDWLLPVGNFLSAFTDTVGCDFVAGYENRIVYANLEITNHWPITLEVGMPFKASYRAYAFERRVLVGWGLPIPYVKNPLRSTNVISALALLTQLRK